MRLPSCYSLAIAVGCCIQSCKAAYLPPLTQPYYPPDATCIEYSVPVAVDTNITVFGFPQWTDDYALEDFLQIATTRTVPGAPSIVVGTAEDVATYTIAASFCTPNQATAKAGTIILATPGIGLAREHWNSPYQPDDYNFVQYAIAQGYSVFFYDRLGTGDSTKISGYSNQINIQVAILQQLATLIGAGSYTGSIGVPSKLVLLGYSYGSYITHALIGSNPDIADAVVLTGIGFNQAGLDVNGLIRSFVPRIASLQNSSRFGELDTGYLTWVDEFAQANLLFKRPYYDVPTLEFSEENKEAFAIAELFTLLAGNGGNLDASGFTGAALAIAGEEDFIVCDGDCDGIYDEPASTYYQNANPFVPYIQPNMGHNINFHLNATGAYGVITGFLDANGF